MAVKLLLRWILVLLLAFRVLESAPVFAQNPVSNTPYPIFFADAFTQSSELDEYVTTGFNTLIVRLVWRASPDGVMSSSDLQAARELAKAGAAKGLKIIYSLPPAPAGQEREFRVAGDSDPYFLLWTTWTKNAIEQLKTTPNLLGWMLPDDPRALPFTNDVGFSKWLAANYADVQVLNTQWNSQFKSLDDVTINAANAVVTNWRDQREAMKTARTSNSISKNKSEQAKKLQEQLLAQQSPMTHWPFHPAQLALAHYKWDAYKLLLSRWARTIKEADSARFVISGRLPDYAQLLSLPPEVDISLPDLRPGFAEADILTHNPQAVDVARRGGRFKAVPIFATSSNNVLRPEVLPLAIGDWLETAQLHGASGAGFSSWPDLLTNADLRRAISQAIAQRLAPEYRELWSTQPLATAAIVLAPLADGHTLEQGPPSWSSGPRGLYGFGEGMTPGEPSNVVYSLRWGTSFGPVDYLSSTDLELGEAEKAAPLAAVNPLSRYSTVLLPGVYSVSPDAALSLTNYVSGGGVAVADLGLGAAQSGAGVLAMSPTLGQLFGIPAATTLSTASFDLEARNANPLFPMWSRPASNGSNLLTGGAPNETAFNGPVAYFSGVPNGTFMIGEAPSLRFATAITPQGGGRRLESGLYLHPVGMGAAVYAPFQLWSNWRPDHIGFGAFHSDLWVRGAGFAVLTSPGFVPAPGPLMGEGAPIAPQVTNYPQAIVVKNLHPKIAAQVTPIAPQNNPPQTRPQVSRQVTPRPSGATSKKGAATVTSTQSTEPVASPLTQHNAIQTANAQNFLWSDAIAVYALPGTEGSANLPLAPGRIAPWGNAQGPNNIPFVTLHVAAKAGETKAMRLRPVQVQNATGPMVATLKTYESKSIGLLVWPNANKVMPRGDQFGVSPGTAGSIRITVFSGAESEYSIAANSRHRVLVSDLLARPDAKGKKPAPVEFIATANENKAITFETKGAVLSVAITPIS